MPRAMGLLTAAFLLAASTAPVLVDGPSAAASSSAPTGSVDVVRSTGYATGKPYGLRVPHTVTVVMPTNLGAYPFSADDAAAEVDRVLAWWLAALPEAFVSLTRTGPPTQYVSATNPGPPYCAMDTMKDLDEVYTVSGTKPTTSDGVAKHVLVLLPPACRQGKAGGSGMPSNSYSDGWSYAAPLNLTDLRRIFAHEFGHNLGFNHANSQCGVGCPDGRPETHVMEYADCNSVMGVNVGVVSTAARAQGGLLQQGEAVSFDGLGGGIDEPVVLQPRGAESGLRGLELSDPETRQTWYVDYRSNTGLDAVLGPSACSPGITVSTIGPRRTTVLVPRTGSAASGSPKPWQAGDTIVLSPNVSVAIKSFDPSAGASLEVHVASLPAFGSTPTARIGGMRSNRGIARVLVTHLRPKHARLSYRWFLDGELLRDLDGNADDVRRMRLDWYQGQLAAEVTAYRAGHRVAVVRTPPVRVLGVLPGVRPWISGDLRVGSRLKLRYRHPQGLPKHLKVRCTWRVGNVQQATHGLTLDLTPRMAGEDVQVTMEYRAKGYRWASQVTNLEGPIRG